MSFFFVFFCIRFSLLFPSLCSVYQYSSTFVELLFLLAFYSSSLSLSSIFLLLLLSFSLFIRSLFSCFSFFPSFSFSFLTFFFSLFLFVHLPLYSSIVFPLSFIVFAYELLKIFINRKGDNLKIIYKA